MAPNVFGRAQHDQVCPHVQGFLVEARRKGVVYCHQNRAPPPAPISILPCSFYRLHHFTNVYQLQKRVGRRLHPHHSCGVSETAPQSFCICHVDVFKFDTVRNRLHTLKKPVCASIHPPHNQYMRAGGKQIDSEAGRSHTGGRCCCIHPSFQICKRRLVGETRRVLHSAVRELSLLTVSQTIHHKGSRTGDGRHDRSVHLIDGVPCMNCQTVHAHVCLRLGTTRVLMAF
mmetsp:Transcript_297/g.710  ORF Transcript_297/g.710 Transcript_297/m.710 type:complete len:229 (+) Transcript_297:782-1468(+)